MVCHRVSFMSHSCIALERDALERFFYSTGCWVSGMDASLHRHLPRVLSSQIPIASPLSRSPAFFEGECCMASMEEALTNAAGGGPAPAL